MTSQRIGKYACLEVECRYLLDRLPGDPPDNSQGWIITDRYLPNTRLRLRHMKSIPGDEDIYKLTQKYRSEAQGPYEATITNVYLTEAEYRLFEVLEAKVLRKRRYPHTAQGRSYGIDVFEGRHMGLVLAELELENNGELDGLVLPSFALADVTADPFFTGGSLAVMTDEEFQQGLSQRLRGREGL